MKDLWKVDLDAFLEKLDVRNAMLLGYIIHIDKEHDLWQKN